MKIVGWFVRRIGLAGLVLACGIGWGQEDHDLTTARTWIGRALFVRGFYGADDLRFDAAGRVMGTPKVVDWTLAGMDVQTVERKAPDAIELDGVRVAIRYNPDNRFFERHAQKEEHMKVTIATAGAGGMEKALGAIFAVGVDPAMQRAMPDYWKHYFLPGEPWAGDALGSRSVAAVAGDVTAPVAVKMPEAKYPAMAQHDHVAGTVTLRLVVDEEGVARHVVVAGPVGYGLDREAAEAVAHWQWRPAMRDGKAVAASLALGMSVTPF